MPENKQDHAARIWVAMAVASVLAVAGLIISPDFRAYISAVLSHWVVLMSGIVSVAITFYEKIRESMGKYALYSVAAMCVFFAGFQAWQDQHSALIKAEITKPDFLLTIPQMTTQQQLPNPGYISVFAQVLLINRGVDSVAVNWGALYKSDKITKEVPIGRLINPERLQQGKFVLVINPDSYIYDKTSQSPVVRGAMADGVVMLKVPTKEWEDIVGHRAKLLIKVSDYLANDYFGDATPKQPHAEINGDTFTAFPGMTLEPNAPPKK